MCDPESTHKESAEQQSRAFVSIDATTVRQGRHHSLPKENLHMTSQGHNPQAELEILQTQIHQAREELSALRMRQYALYDSAPLSFCIVNAQGVILYANPATGNLLGETCAGLIDRPISRFIVEDDQDIYDRHGKALFATGEPQVFELRITRNDGALFWLQLHAFIRAAGDTVICSLVILDISRQKKLEKVLEAHLRLKEFAPAGAIEELLQATVDEAETLTESTTGFYLLLGREWTSAPQYSWSSNTLQYICTSPQFEPCSALDHAAILRERLKKGKPYINNFSSDPSHAGKLPPGHPPLTRELIVPVIREDAIVALLCVGNKATPYNDIDIQVVSTLADLVWAKARHQRTREALQESNNRLQVIMNSINAIIYIADIKTHDLLFVNEYGLQIFGEDSIGKKCWQVLQGLDFPCPFCTNDKLLSNNGDSSGIYRWRYQNNFNQRWYDAADRAIQWTDGRMVRMEIAIDITEHKLAEEALWVSMRQQHLAGEAATARFKKQADTLTSIYQALDSIGLISCDLLSNDISINFFNAGAEKLFGWQQEEAAGKSITIIYPPEAAAKIPEQACEFQQGKTRQSFDMTLVRRSGECFPAVVSIHPYDYHEGRFRKAVGVFRDISELIHIQKKLEISNKNLEHRVELRTRELQESQKQLLHGEKLAAIGQLSASIAHEFNSPLQGILTILKGVQKRAILEEEDRELLEAAIGEGYRLKSLIHNLQDFNRPSSGLKTLMDIHSSLDSTLLLHKSDLKMKMIQLECRYAERLPKILAVPDQIRQVFLNLLANAADACRDSGGTITVSTKLEGDRVAVVFQDSGIGMSPEEIELIFRPFYTTKPAVKGTGLGLSVSYGIVNNHGGEIVAQSRPGEGSTFTVLLPISKSAAPPPQQGEDHQIVA